MAMRYMYLVFSTHFADNRLHQTPKIDLKK